MCLASCIQLLSTPGKSSGYPGRLSVRSFKGDGCLIAIPSGSLHIRRAQSVARWNRPVHSSSQHTNASQPTTRSVNIIVQPLRSPVTRTS